VLGVGAHRQLLSKGRRTAYILDHTTQVVSRRVRTISLCVRVGLGRLAVPRQCKSWTHAPLPPRPPPRLSGLGPDTSRPCALLRCSDGLAVPFCSSAPYEQPMTTIYVRAESKRVSASYGSNARLTALRRAMCVRGCVGFFARLCAFGFVVTGTGRSCGDASVIRYGTARHDR